jgi:ubiquinone/menaquinone biosynthesis C-methylase UbiE
VGQAIQATPACESFSGIPISLTRYFGGVGVAPGTRLPDVGCGAGQLALIAARAGANVHGCDIAANWLEKARERAAAEGLEIVFEEDAESLPYGDAQFETVVSLIAAVFAPQPDLVAAELTRVCRAGQDDCDGQLDARRVRRANV